MIHSVTILPAFVLSYVVRRGFLCFFILPTICDLISRLSVYNIHHLFAVVAYTRLCGVPDILLTISGFVSLIMYDLSPFSWLISTTSRKISRASFFLALPFFHVKKALSSQLARDFQGWGNGLSSALFLMECQAKPDVIADQQNSLHDESFGCPTMYSLPLQLLVWDWITPVPNQTKTLLS